MCDVKAVFVLFRTNFPKTPEKTKFSSLAKNVDFSAEVAIKPETPGQEKITIYKQIPALTTYVR